MDLRVCNFLKFVHTYYCCGLIMYFASQKLIRASWNFHLALETDFFSSLCYFKILEVIENIFFIHVKNGVVLIIFLLSSLVNPHLQSNLEYAHKHSMLIKSSYFSLSPPTTNTDTHLRWNSPSPLKSNFSHFFYPILVCFFIFQTGRKVEQKLEDKSFFFFLIFFHK